MDKLLVAQYGCGKMAAYIMRYVYENGGQIVAAFDVDDNIIGKDIGEIMGIETKGVKVEHADTAADVLKEHKPHVCLIATASTMREVESAYRTCAECGINAISIAEEAFYPWNSSPRITMELDQLAKENRCTLTGSGYQDVYWANLITTMSGSISRLKAIHGTSIYNIEDYGIALARAHGAGLSMAEFEQEIAAPEVCDEDELKRRIETGEFAPSYMWNVNGWLASALGLRVKRQRQRSEAIPAHFDLESKTLGITIKEGDARGLAAVVTTETEEGITIASQCIGKVYTEHETDINEWKLMGEPGTTLTIPEPATVELTCATMVNRIPDVLNAPYGYWTTNFFPVPRYRERPLRLYVDEDIDRTQSRYTSSESNGEDQYHSTTTM